MWGLARLAACNGASVKARIHPHVVCPLLYAAGPRPPVCESFPTDSTTKSALLLWTLGAAATTAWAASQHRSAAPVRCKWRSRSLEPHSLGGTSDDTAAAVRHRHQMTGNTSTTDGKRPDADGANVSDDKLLAPAQDNDNNPLWRSKENRPLEKKFEETAIFAGSSNPILASAIAGRLGTSLGQIRLKRFADGEVSLQFLDSLRGKDVYIIQATSPPVNENLMELLLMISTSRRASAKKITAVIPYYGYARQDRKLSSRVPISAADVARMIEAMGADRVISVDLHSGQIQGFFGPRVPVDNLEAQIIGLDYFTDKQLDKPVVVSPDAGGVYRARKFQEGLRKRGAQDVGLAVLVKQRARANEIERMDLVGSVEDCDVVIVDDMIDTAGTLCEAASQLRKNGAKRVFAFATHGLFSGPALDRIENSPLEEVVVADSIQLSATAARSSRITQLSIAVLIADAIRRIHQKESLEQLFAEKNV